MDARDIFSYAFDAIKLRKLRAALTTLGVVIGIAAIVALLSLGQGFQVAITAQFERGFATNTLIVSPRGFGLTESSIPLYVNDTLSIDAIDNVIASAGIVQRTCYIKSSKGTLLVNVAGVDYVRYMNIYASTFAASRGSIPLSPDNGSIVIGARINDPGQNGTTFLDVNDTVEIIWTKRSGFTVTNKTYIGHVSAVLNEIGGFGFSGPSDSGVYIPISQAQSFFETDQANSIIVQLKSADDATIKQVSADIRDGFSGQVTVTSPTALLSTISTVFSIVQLFLAGIAGISLLVAGIGIMNIMIVSLMERTREIGILKALGMKGRTVLLIFLTEAIIIGLLGASIGIALGWTLAELVSRFGFLLIGGAVGNGGGIGGGIGGGMAQGLGGGELSIKPVLTPTVLLGALGFGIMVSVFFAIYPAWRASRLKPVEALRYE